MSLPLPRPRSARALLALALAATGLTCRDRSLTGPSLPVQTSLAVAPTFQVARGAPVLLLSRARVTLGAHPGNDPIVADELRSFSSGASSVSFDLTVPVAGESQRFVLRIAGIDAAGDTVYRASDTVTVRAGDEPSEPLSVALTYAGPDTVVRFLDLAPRDTTLTVGDSLLMRAQAYDAQEALVPGAAIGWTVADSAIFRVNRATGRIRALREGTTWLYAGTFNGTIDSTEVTAFMPVARVAISPDSVGAVPGDTVTFAAQTFGLDDQPVAGRAITFTALDTNVVVLGTTGRVLARSPGRGRVVASSEGRADTAKIDVGQPVPTTIDVAGDSAVVVRTRTLALTATVRDRYGVVIPNAPRSWTSRRPTVASVDTAGVVTALAADSAAWIVAGSGAARDSIRIVVARLGVASVGVTPSPATLTVGAGLQLTATPRDSAGQPNFDHPIAWASSDTMKARVSPTGVVTGRDSGTVAITATAGGVTGTASVTVQLVRVASVAISPDTLRTTAGDSVPVSAVARDSAGNVLAGRLAAWRMADSTVAQRLASGFVRGVRQGTTFLYVTVDGVSDTAMVIVAPPPVTITGVTVEPPVDTLRSLGDTLALVATAFSDAQPVPATITWASRDTAVVRVDGAGRAVSRANGQAWIVATTAGLSDSALVVVRQALASATVIPASSILYLDRQAVLTVDARDARNQLIAAPAISFRSRSGGRIVGVDSTQGARAFVRGLALGSDTIDVQSPGGGNGAVVASALIEVRTAITSVAVTLSADTARAAGQRVTALAVARDSASATMPGIAFAFAISDTSVARIDSTFPDRVVLLAKQNGTVTVVASAQGVSSPPVPLVVSRAIVLVRLTPAAATVDIGGTLPMVAEALDPNDQPIAGVAFAWDSDAPTVASVDASGIVRGLTGGTARIRATAGGVQSPQAVITVRESRLRFGADTLVIGTPGSATIPITRSGDVSAPVTVQLLYSDSLSSDSAASLSTRSLSYGAGVATQYVTITGRVAGTRARVIAVEQNIVDGPTPPPRYGPDTLYLEMRAGIRFSQSFQLSVGDTATATLSLADPAPTGGARVTFTYGTPGIARVTQDTVTIGAGLLTASVRVAGLATGQTTITPVSGATVGVPATATVTEPTLSIVGAYTSGAALHIGAGQVDRDYFYVMIPAPRVTPLAVTLASGNTGISRTDTTVVIPAGSYYAGFPLRGMATGRDTVTASAAGWTSARREVIVTSPGLLACCASQIAVGESRWLDLNVADSLRVEHRPQAPVMVSASSSNPAVLAVDASTVTLPANSFYDQQVPIRGVAVGSAWVRLSASGHAPDSVLVTVEPPALSLTTDTITIGLGQSIDWYPAVYLPGSPAAPVTVRVQYADRSVATSPDSFVVAAGNSYATGGPLLGNRLGATMMVVSADGYLPDTGWVRVVTPVLHLNGPAVVSLGSSPALYAYSGDSTNNYADVQQALAVSFASLDPSILGVSPSSAVIAAGTSSASVSMVPVAAGVARVVATAPGYQPDTFTVSVQNPALDFAVVQTSIGLQQRSWNPLYIFRETAPQAPLTISLQLLDPGLVSIPATVQIASGASSAPISFTGTGLGVARVVATAPGYDPDTVRIIVAPPALSVDSIYPGQVGETSALFVYSSDTAGLTYNMPPSRMIVNVSSSDTTIVKPLGTTVAIDSTSYYSTQVNLEYRATGTATVTFTDAQGIYRPVSRTVTVQPPRLSFTSSLYTVGMRQRTLYSELAVCRGFAATASFTVRLATSNGAIATAPDSVVINQGANCAYFDVTGGSQAGTVSVVASGAGQLPDTASIEVGQPGFLLETAETLYAPQGTDQAYLYIVDQAGNTRVPLDTLRVTLLSSNPAAARFDSTAITIPAGQTYEYPGIQVVGVGRTVFRAVDERTAAWAYTPGIDTTDVVTPPLIIDLPSIAIGSLQRSGNDFAYVGYTNPGDIRVTLTSSRPAVAVPSVDTLIIPAGGSYERFQVYGGEPGTATITLSAPGHLDAVKTVRVDRGAVAVNWPDTVGVGQGFRVTLTITDSLGNARIANVETMFTLSSSNASLDFTADGPAITAVVIPDGQSSTSFFVRGLAAGSADVTVSHPSYRPLAPKTIVVRPSQ